MTTNGHQTDRLIAADRFLTTESKRGVQLSLFKEVFTRLGLFQRETSETGEASYGAPEAPWSPVPLKQAREYIRANETRQIDFVFPTVFEEDRSTKLKDISTAQGLDYISHQRASEMVAQELEVENYDWLTEMTKVKEERKQFGDVLPAPGAGLQGGKLGGITIGAPAPGLAAEDDFEDEDLEIPGVSDPRLPQRPQVVIPPGPNDDLGGKHHRAERSQDFTARFKKQQRESMKVLKAMNRGIRRMLEAGAALSETQRGQLVEAQKETQGLRESILGLGEKIASLRDVQPIVHVTLPEPKLAGPVTRKVTRDPDTNLISSITEEPV